MIVPVYQISNNRYLDNFVPHRDDYYSVKLSSELSIHHGIDHRLNLSGMDAIVFVDKLRQMMWQASRSRFINNMTGVPSRIHGQLAPRKNRTI